MEKKSIVFLYPLFSNTPPSSSRSDTGTSAERRGPWGIRDGLSVWESGDSFPEGLYGSLMDQRDPKNPCEGFSCREGWGTSPKHRLRHPDTRFPALRDNKMKSNEIKAPGPCPAHSAVGCSHKLRPQTPHSGAQRSQRTPKETENFIFKYKVSLDIQ